MHRVGDIAFAIVVVAGVMVLTRKGSQGAAVINAVGGAFAGAIGAATGGGAAAGTRAPKRRPAKGRR